MTHFGRCSCCALFERPNGNQTCELYPFDVQLDAVAWENLSETDRATIEAMGVEAAKLSSGGKITHQI